MSWTQFGLHCSIAWRSSSWTAARQIGKLRRKVATRVDSGQLAAPTTIGAGDVKQYLGRSRFTSEVAERTDTPGIATGLAVTGVGGDVLFIEAAHMDGDQDLTLTGQLG